MKNFLKSNERLDDLQFKNLFIIQDPKGYCFTSDAVALANFGKCKKGGIIVDLCSGSGVIGILASEKLNAKHTYLIELQEKLADMSRRSVEMNNLQEKIEVVNKPLQNVYKLIGVTNADLVFCNPPYKKNNSGVTCEIDEQKIAKHEVSVTFDEIAKEASKLLKFGGKFVCVNKEERLVELFSFLSKYDLEPKILKILPSVKGANTIMIEAIKGGHGGIKILI